MRKYPDALYNKITDNPETWGSSKTKEDAIKSAEKWYDKQSKAGLYQILIGGFVLIVSLVVIGIGSITDITYNIF